MGTDIVSETPAASSTIILLVRHGVTPTTGKVLPGRAPGLHLSEEGREQARTVAQRVGQLPVRAVYASPLERTRETAAPTAEHFGLEATLHDGLLECEFGEWTGEDITALAKLPEWQTVQKTPSEFRFPGGESFVEMRDRIVGTLAELAARHPGEVIVCFSHADPLKAAITHLQGKDLDQFQGAAVDPASMSVAEFRQDGSTRMVAVNTTSGELGRLRAARRR